MDKYRFETLQLHVGQESADPVTDARAVRRMFWKNVLQLWKAVLQLWLLLRERQQLPIRYRLWDKMVVIL